MSAARWHGSVVTIVALAVGGCGSTAMEPRAAIQDGDVRVYTASQSDEAGTDSLLAARLAKRLQNDPMTHASSIQVTVIQGRARLTGFVHNAAARLRAIELAQQTEGIVTVENRLILRYHAGLALDPIGGARVHL